jgi:hypothetical protein
MAYTTINKSTDNFNTLTYTGGSGDTAHTGVGFQPDLVWIKERTRTRNHAWFDVIRGSRYWIGSNSNNAEDYNSGAYLVSFDSDGFTTTDSDVVGKNGYTYASWNWKANGAGSSNGNGTITSTVSANTTAGFSIVSYTGNGTTGATVGHGLGVKPNMIILKYRNAGSTNWQVYHSSLGATKYLQLNSNGASTTSNTRWNDTEPTNQVFTLGSSGDVKTNGGQYIAYCFAEKRGFSKFGAYDGNGNADGTFVYTGFKPAFVMIKKTDSTGYWVIQDNKRTSTSGTNPNDKWIYPNVNDAEYDASSYPMDLLSNGFKVRHTGNYQNTANNYIYMAFGQSLVGSNNVPCTAR